MKNKTIANLTILTLGLCLFVSSAEAKHRRYREVLTVLPRDHHVIVVDQSHYFYTGGLFYRHDQAGRVYRMVPAPYGAVVTVLPHGCKTAYFKGIKHYYRDSVYYRPEIRSGRTAYVVVRIER